LEAACQSLNLLNINIAVVQETKIPDGKHTRFSSGYNVFATNAPSKHQRGVALIWREGRNDLYEVEETRRYGPNVLAFQLVMGADRYYVIGCYIPPSDRTPYHNFPHQKGMEQLPDHSSSCSSGFQC